VDIYLKKIKFRIILKSRMEKFNKEMGLVFAIDLRGILQDCTKHYQRQVVSH